MLIWIPVGMLIAGCAASHIQTAAPVPQHQVPSTSTSTNYAELWTGEYEGKGDVHLTKENEWLRDKRFELRIHRPVLSGSGHIRIVGTAWLAGDVENTEFGPQQFDFSVDLDNPSNISGDWAIHLTGVQHSIPRTLGGGVISATPGSQWRPRCRDASAILP